MEKRILGRWLYGKDQVYELKVEPWGALIFAEDSLKVSLTRVSMLRWRGDVGMVEGMYLVLEYEPASDTIETEFIPPEHLEEPEPKKVEEPAPAPKPKAAPAKAAPTPAPKPK